MSNRRTVHPIARELASTLALATPVVVTNLGLVAMGLVDTLVIGRVNAASIAGVGAGSGVFYTVSIVGMGVLGSMDTMVSQAFGAREHALCKKLLIQGLWLALAMSLLLLPVILTVGKYYAIFGATPDIAATATPFIVIVGWSLPLFLIFVALQKYLQALGQVMPATYIVWIGNVVNYFCSTAFALGMWGAPALGAAGVAIATLATRGFMVAALGGYTWWFVVHSRGNAVECAGGEGIWRVDLPLQVRLLRLGIPAGIQSGLEVLAFTIATTLATQLGADAAAAHHIALTIASTTFMIPLGIGTAGAVRVGNLIGEGHRPAAARAGWMAIGLGVGVMTVSGIILCAFPEFVFTRFSTDPAVLAEGMKIMLCAAVFQIFDGTQVTSTFVLRGVGDTRSAMYANLIGHYPIGLALGVTLCFGVGLGLRGLWTGLAAGLMSVAMMTVLSWRRRARALY